MPSAAPRVFPQTSLTWPKTIARLVGIGFLLIMPGYHGIGFIPWFPLASERLAQPGSILDGIARAHNATVGQIAIAWLLARSRVMLPIPGTSSVTHLRENARARHIRLSAAELEQLSRTH